MTPRSHDSGKKKTDPGHSHSHPVGHAPADEYGYARQSEAAKKAPARKILTVRALSGLSGDMMLAGLATMAELSNAELALMVSELNLPALEGSVELVAKSVCHVMGTGCEIRLPHEHAHRTLQDVRAIIQNSDMPEAAREYALAAFTLLASAEACVHGKQPDEVTFHEVGALDSILDTCLCCRIFTLLAPDAFVCSPLPLADGTVRCAHGAMPSPAPAVLAMLGGVPVRPFSGAGETVTPTALSLLKALGVSFGPWPEMTVQKTAISYGTKVFVDAPNGALWALGKSGVL